MDPRLLQQLAMGGAGSRAFEPKALIQFKSGMMDFNGRTVTPKRDKGLIRVVLDEQTGSKAFQWCDAETKKVIRTWYCYPDEAKFEKVKQSKDRVYLLEFKQTSDRFFFWMQVSISNF